MRGRPGRENRPAPFLHMAWARVTMDLVFVAATVVFFAISLAYVVGCDRL